MEDAGARLKRVRERLNLRYRDVEEASQKIAERQKSDEFVIALSRLADIENRGTVPSVYRLYSLCAIYRLDFAEVLEWYGVRLADLATDSAAIEVEKTHRIGFSAFSDGDVQIPLALDPGVDFRRTTFLSRMIQKWGKLPLVLLQNVELPDHRYGFIGSEDWTMYPLLQPGSLIIIDESKRKIVTSGWTHELERPIYFLEHREGFSCGWCSVNDGKLILEPHPASQCLPEVYDHEEVDIVGQVVGVAMRLDIGRRRRARGESR